MLITVGLLLLFFGGMLAFSLGQRFYFCKNSKFSLTKLDNFSSIYLCLSIVLGGTFLYGANPNLPLYTWIVMLGLLGGLFYFSQKKQGSLQKTLFQFGICALGVFGVFMPMPQANIFYWLQGFILLISWYLGWQIFTNFDRYPMTSSLVSTGWGIAFLLILSIFWGFPPAIGLFAVIMGISVYVACNKRSSYGILNLGPCSSEIAGFAWAGIWTACLLQADMSVLVLAYGYYIMEMIFLATRFFKKKPLETLLMQALSNEKRRKKAFSNIFVHVVAMAFVVALLTIYNVGPRMTIYISLLFSFVVIADLYNHLKNWERPIGTWKDIFSTVKEGVSALPKASSHLAKEVKSSLKTQTKKKKLVVKKKTVKKKESKKKK